MGERSSDGTTQSMAPDDGFGAAMSPSAAPGSGAARVGPSPITSTPIRDPQRYAVLGEHGRGALGRVSRAHDKELGRDVAIKELIVRDPRGEARFLREALITARLEHPGIVAVHEAGRWPNGTPFYAMKLVSGRPLRELMLERATVEERIGLLHHVIAVADAIAYAHGCNIIHRDLKPANVIVGDFGETVVVDWGLAKDLSAVESSARGRDIRASSKHDVADNPASKRAVDGGTSAARVADGGTVADGAAAKRAAAERAAARGPTDEPSASSSELTQVGTVLGTPAYMAPEQERGDPVDRRADVFAIGVMLWELCAPSRALPSQTQARHQLLRRAGIDDDLISILDKALDPDPERRYADAGALANDLKAFKAGARVAARSYSPLAMLAHWTRRHRALTLSVAAVVIAALVGGFAYIRNIAVERDRADASEMDARRARVASDTALDQLTLNHAQLWLSTDPSAAIDALAGYHGADQARAEQIRAEAIGHGVALRRVAPHTNRVLWAEGTADGAIVSLSADGTIARTARDGTTAVVARGVSRLGAFSYARSRRLLAYTCDSTDLCVLDVEHATPIPTAVGLPGRIADLAFSPDEARLVVISQDAVVSILDLANPAQPSLRFTKPVSGGQFAQFVDDELVVVIGATGVTVLRENGGSDTFSLPNILRTDASATEHRLVLATATGEAVVLTGLPLRVEARNQLCHGLIFDVKFIPARRSVAYACRAGAVGVWDLQRNTVEPRVHLEGVAGNIAISPDGDYVIATSGNGTVTVLDLATEMLASYKGHGNRLTSIAAPTPEHPFVISGDAGGAIRSWTLPPRVARVAARSSMSFHAAIFHRRSTTVMATSLVPELTVYSPATGARVVQPHDAFRQFLEQSSTGDTFAAYGLHDVIEFWSSETLTRTRVSSTGHGSVSQLHFVDDTDDFTTAGHDGRLIRWKRSGEHRVIAKLDQAIDSFVHVGATAPQVMVVGTVDGALWRTDDRGRTIPLRSGGARVTQLVASADRRTVYAGYADGQVLEIDTTSWRQQTVLRAKGAVQAVDVASDGRTLAVAAEEAIHVRTQDQAGSRPDAGAWVTLAARARHVAVARDGLVIAASAHGTIWLYSPKERRWQCLIIEGADLNRSVVAMDGRAAVALDRGGRLLWIDLESARRLFLATN